MNDLNENGKALLRFLKENDYYRKFMRNFHNKSKENIKFKDLTHSNVGFIEFCNKAISEYYIDIAFNWVLTKEGSDFWEDVSTQWKYFYYGYVCE